MSEQLWYTWSSSGLGMTTEHRIRAASPGLLKDVNSERVRSLMRYISYPLPQAIDANTISVEDAPICLAFIEAGRERERILVNKTYIGLDGFRRSGAFFSHLLVKLPQVKSQHTNQLDEFLAQDAIKLWRSTFWRDSDKELEARQLDLPEVSQAKLQPGDLTAQHVVDVQDFLPFVIQALLTLQSQQHLYIAADPDTVAALIWGLTYALPRSLKVMHKLTFSTYESEIEKAPTTIVGTCLLSTASQSARYDLPANCYRGNGLAINCYPYATELPSGGRSHLSENSDEASFAQFATQCFVKHELLKLEKLVGKAERANITEVKEFLVLYKTMQKKLEKPHIVELFISLIKTFTRPLKLGQKEEDIQREQKEKAEILKEENVQTSIIDLIDTDRPWWRDEGRFFIRDLSQLVVNNVILADALSSLAKTLTDKIWNLIQSNQEKDVFFWNEILTISTPSTIEPDVWGHLLERLSGITYTDTYQVWWNSIAKEKIKQLHSVADKNPSSVLNKNLSSYSETVANNLQTAISKNWNITLFWEDVLAVCAPLTSLLYTYIWLTLIQNLSDAPYNPAFQQWWFGQGKAAVTRLRINASTDTKLADALTDFIEKAAEKVGVAIEGNDLKNLDFCADVLIIAAPIASVPIAWIQLLKHLTLKAMQMPAFERWWSIQGQTAIRYLRESGNSQITRELSSIKGNALAQFETMTRSSTTTAELTLFWGNVLFEIAPPTKVPEVWTDLLERLSRGASTLSICTSYHWQVRSWLLEVWGHANSIKGDNVWLRQWLTVRWSELKGLLSLSLPPNWFMLAIIELLKIIFPQQNSATNRKAHHASQIIGGITRHPADDLPPNEIVRIVTDHTLVFEETMQYLMRRDLPEQETAIQFFGMLVENGYTEKIAILSKMLAELSGASESASRLLTLARLKKSERADLLENHSEANLSKQPLPQLFVNLLGQYLEEFTVDDLYRPSARALLERLQKPEMKSRLTLSGELVHLWCKISEFIHQPIISRNWLRDLRNAIKAPQLVPEVRSKLTDLLLEPLTNFVSNDADLTRVTDYLGSVLMGAGTPQLPPELLLLERLAQNAGAKYGAERPPRRIIPYIIFILGEAESIILSIPIKEEYIERCLTDKLKLNKEAIETIERSLKNNEYLWPAPIFNAWKVYVAKRRKELSVRSKGEPKASPGREIQPVAIILPGVQSNPALPVYMDAQSHSPNVIHTPVIESKPASNLNPRNWGLFNRDKQQEEEMKIFREALRNKQVEQIVRTYPHAFSEKTFQEEYDRFVLARQFVEALQSNNDLAIADAYTAIDNSSYAKKLDFTAEQRQRIDQALAAKLAFQQRAVARVNKYSITQQQHDLVMKLKGAYLQYHSYVLQEQIKLTPSKKKQGEAEIAAIQALLNSPPLQLSQTVLDDLVNDLLIQEGIKEQQTKANSKHLNPEGELKNVLKEFKAYQGESYQSLLTTLQLTEKEVKEVLLIYVRRDCFARYLYEWKATQLEEWLAKRKKEAVIQY